MRRRVGETTNLVPVVHPGAEFEMTGLVVERKVHHIDRTGWPELGRRRPEHTSVMIHHGQTSEQPLGIVISTEMTNITRISLQCIDLRNRSSSALRSTSSKSRLILSEGLFCCFLSCNEPVVKNYVGKPDFIARYPHHINSTKLLRIPLEQLVVPFVIKPDIGRQNLVLLILPKMLINWEIWQIFVINLHSLNIYILYRTFDPDRR